MKRAALLADSHSRMLAGQVDLFATDGNDVAEVRPAGFGF